MLKTIAYPQSTFRWLGLKVRSFRISLLKKGYWSSTYQHIRVKGENIDGSELLEGDLPEKVEDGVLYLCCMEAEMTPVELGERKELFDQLQRKWIPVIQEERERIKKCFEKKRPSAVLSIQGYEPSSWVARTEAIRLGIPIVAVENTALNDRLLWDSYSGIAVNRNLSANYYWRFADSVNEEEVKASISAMIQTSKDRKSSDHVSPDESADLPQERPIVLFLGQVYTDSSILFGLGAWKSPIEVLEATLEATRAAGAVLVVKLHPKEASGSAPIIDVPYRNLTYRKMMDRESLRAAIEEGEHLIVDHDNRWNTYDLILKAKLAVTINSQAGLEATIRDTPTIVCGQAFYGDLGFTQTASSRDSLISGVSELLGASAKENWFYRGKCFSHIFFEYYCIKKSEVDLAALMKLASKQSFSPLISFS